MIRPLHRRTRPTGRHRNPLRASVLAAALTLVLLGADAAVAAPAGADGAGPTNFESLIDRVEPRPQGVRVDVVGGDSFLRVRADAGTEVRIPGYDGEPYLRIDADGSVHRNERSSATYLNTTRDGTGVELPDEVDSTGEPRWTHVGDGGEVAWHDHRIHWMVSQAPVVGEDQLVQRWMVPLVVDGSEVEVSGRLLLYEDELPWALAVALLAAAAAVAAASRVRSSRVPLLAVAAGVALALAVAAHAVNPPDAGASIVAVVLPALALVLALASLFLRGSLRHVVLPLASVAALTGWVVGRAGVLWMPVLPTRAPEWAERAGTGLALGVAVGLAVAILLRPVPAPEGTAGGHGRDQRSTGRSPSVQSAMPPRS